MYGSRKADPVGPCSLISVTQVSEGERKPSRAIYRAVRTVGPCGPRRLPRPSPQRRQRRKAPHRLHLDRCALPLHWTTTRTRFGVAVCVGRERIRRPPSRRCSIASRMTQRIRAGMRRPNPPSTHSLRSRARKGATPTADPRIHVAPRFCRTPRSSGIRTALRWARAANTDATQHPHEGGAWPTAPEKRNPHRAHRLVGVLSFRRSASRTACLPVEESERCD